MSPSSPLLDATTTPPSAWRRILHRACEIIAGAPAAAGDSDDLDDDGIRVDPEQAPPPRGEVLITAFGQAIGEFHYEQVRPYRKYSPHWVYQLHQICVVRSSDDNLKLISDFERMDREQRKDIFKAKLAEFNGFDVSEFADVRIEDAGTKGVDPVFVVAGEGPQRAHLRIEFHGEFVQQAGPTPAKQDAAAPAMRTAPPSAVATTLPMPTERAHGANATLLLNISEPGHPPRAVTVQNFPARIGRSEDCDVVLQSPYISRLHATLIQEHGAFRVVDSSQVGTQLDGRALTRDTETPLTDGTVLTFAPSAEIGASVAKVSVLPPPAAPLLPSQVATTLPPVTASAPAKLSTAHQGHRPLAHLRVHTADGQEEVFDVTELPFEIGRNPDAAAHCIVGGTHANVSRVHLRLTRAQAGAFVVHNLARNANGTWVAGERMGESFTHKPVQRDRKDGWIILGDRALGARSVAVRLEEPGT